MAKTSHAESRHASWVIIYCKDPERFLFGRRTKKSKKAEKLARDSMHRSVQAFSQNPWGLFGGRVDYGETPLVTATRELKEETGLSIDSSDLKELGERKHDYFYMYYAHCDIDRYIRLDAKEFTEVKWFSQLEATSIPVYERHRSVNKFLKFFRTMI